MLPSGDEIAVLVENLDTTVEAIGNVDATERTPTKRSGTKVRAEKREVWRAFESSQFRSTEVPIIRLPYCQSKCAHRAAL